MRAVVGSALVVCASSQLWADPPVNVTVPALVLIGAGILLVVGLWTPIAGTSVALIEVWKMVMLPGDRGAWLLVGTVGVALAMLGPGLWSVDARLYGWKRLEATSRTKVLSSVKHSPND
jgi:uncharacterized membrane protein YphA (DoxX/SURF4 family)